MYIEQMIECDDDTGDDRGDIIKEFMGHLARCGCEVTTDSVDDEVIINK